MEPCKMCGASAFEGCKQAKGLSLGECPYYQRYNTGGCEGMTWKKMPQKYTSDTVRNC